MLRWQNLLLEVLWNSIDWSNHDTRRLDKVFWIKIYLIDRYSFSSYVRFSFLTSVREHPILRNRRLFGRKSEFSYVSVRRHQMSILSGSGWWRSYSGLPFVFQWRERSYTARNSSKLEDSAIYTYFFRIFPFFSFQARFQSTSCHYD